jgi:poly-gamma-glutamate capsule biosynthesis protein CapA/YwtB (metallophosphatase superfamily)
MASSGTTVRIALVGDVMTGRGVADVLANDPDGVFAGVRHLLAAADLVGGNLESPLTTRPHVSGNENRLEADPATAVLLAEAGFDVLSLPNNHSTDAGAAGLLDTITAAGNAGIATVGGGATETAYAPHIETVDGIRIGFLAYDATGVGIPAGDEPGVAGWDEATASEAVADLRLEADVVVVSIHGGTEYLPATDPGMAEIASYLVEAGVDIVWGHGAHVVQPVTATIGDRPSVVATSLGNFLFDQSGPDRTTGYMLEVMVDTTGVVAYRVGVTEHPDRRIEFVDWLDPEGDAAWVHGSWWSLTRPATVAPTTTTSLDQFRHGDLAAAAEGDVDGDGSREVVASFRRPHRSTPFMDTHPEVQWADGQGRSAHVGVYTPDDLAEIWVAGSVLMPVATLEVCDGTLAVVHDRLDDSTPVAGGAWAWNGFGFDTAPTIPGGGTPACADIDGDGRSDPVIIDRR